MNFQGYVQAFTADNVILLMEPSDKGPRELWSVERRRVPDHWLALGAMCELEIDMEDGLVRWTFDSSFIPPNQWEAMQADVKTLQERFGLE